MRVGLDGQPALDDWTEQVDLVGLTDLPDLLYLAGLTVRVELAEHLQTASAAWLWARFG